MWRYAEAFETAAQQLINQTLVAGRVPGHRRQALAVPTPHRHPQRRAPRASATAATPRLRGLFTDADTQHADPRHPLGRAAGHHRVPRPPRPRQGRRRPRRPGAHLTRARRAQAARLRPARNALTRDDDERYASCQRSCRDVDSYLRHNLMLVRTGRRDRAPGIRKCTDCPNTASRPLWSALVCDCRTPHRAARLRTRSSSRRLRHRRRRHRRPSPSSRRVTCSTIGAYRLPTATRLASRSRLPASTDGHPDYLAAAWTAPCVAARLHRPPLLRSTPLWDVCGLLRYRHHTGCDRQRRIAPPSPPSRPPATTTARRYPMPSGR